jgi:hypothetical protein
MLIGIILGTFSSIFVAAPLALYVDNFLKARGILLADPNQKPVAKDPDFCPPVVLKRKPETVKTSGH